MANAQGTYADKFIEEDVFQRCAGRGIQRENAGDPLWRVVYGVEYTCSLQPTGELLDLVVVLNVDDQARDKGSQNLGDDVSGSLEGRELLEERGRNGYGRAEVTSRHGSGDGNGEDDSYGVRNANTEQGYVKRVSG